MTEAPVAVLPPVTSNEGWPVSELGEFAAIRGGVGFPPRMQGQGVGDLPFYKVSDMNTLGNEIRMSKANHYLDEAQLEELRAKPFPAGTIVFPKVGAAIATNKKRILTGRSLIDNNVMGVVPDQGQCISEYLYCWLLTVDLRSISAPGPLPSITGASVGRLRVPLPPPEEQRRIVKVLTAIQLVEQQTEHELRTLSALRTATIAHALNTAMTSVRLGTLINRPQYGYTASASEGNGVRFLRITDLQETGVDWSTVPSCDPEPPIGSRYDLADGDLVVARIGGTTGKAWLVRRPPPSIFASYLIRIRVQDGIDPRYVAAFFESEPYWTQIVAAKGGRLKGGVNIGNLNSLEVPYLEGPAQEALGDQLDGLGRTIDATHRKRIALRGLFSSALSNLFGL